ncbi:MAG: hypothetical protein IKR92_04535 [Alphaproteobacteria bacterium]|nr:hypothetical protein [Alphaproteobacteria bacterium]
MKIGDVTLSGTVFENDRNDYFFVLKVNRIGAEINGSFQTRDLDEPATVKVSHDFHHVHCCDYGDNNPDDNCDLILCGDYVSVTYREHEVIKVENHTPHTDYLSLVRENF